MPDAGLGRGEVGAGLVATVLEYLKIRHVV
jgi:hypothetical protein